MMCDKKFRRFARLVFFSGFVILNFSFAVFAQSEELKAPKIKDFGSSLKHRKSKETTEAKDQSKNADQEIVRINTDLVVSDVLVLDEKGNWVKNLTRDDFIVTENNELQDVEFFALGDDAKVPRSIVLLIDHSSSEIPFIVSSVMSAKILVDSLNPNDRMAIVTDNV